ncbi:MAG: NAD-dependent malic enzyme [Candidatus Dadabacteria bacterium]|nr:MAG: NAD-dependent malic enzyme [Candidatus Dadabacteria bacterium]
MGLPSAGFSVTVRLKIQNKPGNFLKIVSEIAEKEASTAEVVLLYSDFNYNIRDITINCRSEVHSRRVVAALKNLPNIELLEWRDDTFEMHRAGKLEVRGRTLLTTTDELSRAYTPGVARVCKQIVKSPADVFNYTIKSNSVAVVTDGSAVLGLGNIGPEAALPVMEGKAVLFKQFAGINAFPICLKTQDSEKIIEIIKEISPVFGGINLEDISAPRCFEIENRLRGELDIPVFHDDQHGTAIVVLAGLYNALKIVDKKLENIKIVVNGFGAGGVACTRMLLNAGAKNIIPCDSVGIVYRGRKERMNPVKEELIQLTNPDNIKGSVADALKGADAFIGVSRPGAITRDMVASMNKNPIVFALANPDPEILPDQISDIARVIATGRSDYANQVNNVLCFPGLFRGALKARAYDITAAMKVAAATAIAECVTPDELHENYIIPSVFKAEIAKKVAEAVERAAIQDGVARTKAAR